MFQFYFIYLDWNILFYLWSLPNFLVIVDHIFLTASAFRRSIDIWSFRSRKRYWFFLLGLFFLPFWVYKEIFSSLFEVRFYITFPYPQNGNLLTLQYKITIAYTRKFFPLPHRASLLLLCPFASQIAILRVGKGYIKNII